MAISETQLSNWTKRASDHEESMCERSARMIQNAMSRSSAMNVRSYQVQSQGSYHNNTNVRVSSDVDVCVKYTDVVQHDFTYNPSLSIGSLGYIRSNHIFANDRETVGDALVDCFGSGSIKFGNKSFKVNSNINTRVDADVVPAWIFHGHHRTASGGNEIREGIILWSRSGGRVINFPQQHHLNGIIKNNATRRSFKRVVRIIKRLRYYMLDNDVPSADGVSSFEIECAVYNMSNNLFDFLAWQDTTVQILHAMQLDIQSRHAHEWVEVSGLKWMFKHNYGQPSNWSVEAMAKFIKDAIRFLTT
jgi:hypothetical protein